MTDFQITIIGAGIIGLAVARELSLSGKKVLVIEKNTSFGQENSTRNSGVIHAGLYYPYKSFKNKFCSVGNGSLYSYAKDRGISFLNSGKIIVCSSKDEESKLNQIMTNGKKNGLNLEKLSQRKLREFEPELHAESGLLSRTTGIIDLHDLMLNFVADIENNGGFISFNSEFSHSINQKNHISFFLKGKEEYKITTKSIINCAGLYSHIVAKNIAGVSKKKIPEVRYVKGNYMTLTGKSPFKKLIYPIPGKDGLGIHSTINLDGKTLFGPDTVEVNSIDFKVTKNIRRKFIKSISKYWPNIKNRVLNSDYSGIRTKLLNNDFNFQKKKITHDSMIINLFGIESPGLTSSIQIGKHISKVLQSDITL